MCKFRFRFIYWVSCCLFDIFRFLCLSSCVLTNLFLHFLAVEVLAEGEKRAATFYFH